MMRMGCVCGTMIKEKGDRRPKEGVRKCVPIRSDEQSVGTDINDHDGRGTAVAVLSLSDRERLARCCIVSATRQVEYAAEDTSLVQCGHAFSSSTATTP